MNIITTAARLAGEIVMRLGRMMIGLIAIAIMVGWVFFAVCIALVIFALKKWEIKLWRFMGIATVVFLLPFAEEIFIAASFRAHCAVYGGITKLNPVVTDRFTHRVGGGRYAARILSHPAIDAVWIENNTDTVFGLKQFWIGVTQEKEKCDAEVTEKLSSVSGAARRLIKKGFCFNMDDFGPIPSITTSNIYNVKHKRFSPLLPYEVDESRYDVLDISTSEPEVLSSLSNLSIDPGSLRKAIWPHYTPYHCFRAGNKSFQFLEKAIVSGNS